MAIASVINGKSILVIAPEFYNYHNLIINQLSEFGANVTFFSDTDNSRLAKVRKVLGVYSKNDEEFYYSKIANKLNGKRFDYLFVIKGVGITRRFLETVTELNPQMVKLMYQWDSIKNHNYMSLIKCFDKVYTFDFLDANENQDLNYLPLFYSKEIKRIDDEEEGATEDIDLLFIGSYLPERYEALILFVEYCRVNKLKLYHHLYVPRSYYFELKRSGAKVDKTMIQFHPLSENKLLNLYSRSKGIVDISSIHQTGLSMRAIETLGAGKKLLTNNKFVTEHEFYSEEQITILDLNCLRINSKFLELKERRNTDIHCQYLDNWLINIFTGEN